MVSSRNGLTVPTHWIAFGCLILPRLSFEARRWLQTLGEDCLAVAVRKGVRNAGDLGIAMATIELTGRLVGVMVRGA